LPIFSWEDLESEVAVMVVAMGASSKDATWVAQLLVRSNLRGHDSHGVIRIPQYFEACKRGQIHPAARPEIAAETNTSVRVNGNRTFGQVTGRYLVEIVMAKAKKSGMAAAAAFECNHVGRLADYVELLAEQGLVAFAFANDCGANQVVAPFGGLEGRLSTNPLAIAIPGERFPLCLDIATSVVALGKIAVKRNQGIPLPVGWLQDGKGNPVTDPIALNAPSLATLLPMAGHKGYGLAVMVEVLAGILTGAGYSKKELGPDLQGLFLLAFQLKDFVEPETFASQVKDLVSYLKTSCPRPDFQEILIPGELEWRTAQERMREGIPIDSSTWDQIVKVKRELSLA